MYLCSAGKMSKYTPNIPFAVSHGLGYKMAIFLEISASQVWAFRFQEKVDIVGF